MNERLLAFARVLHQQHISAAPVVDSEGRLVGAINLHDLHLAGVG